MNTNWKSRTFVLFSLLLPLALPVSAWAAASGAGYTTFDSTALGCLDSPNGVNCNNYTGKDKVYMSGGPEAGGLSDGCYYFSVLTPGSQNGGFVDGAEGNLSDTTAGGTTGDNGSGDTAGHRTFRVTNEVVTYPDTTCDPASGGHATGTQPGTGKLIVQLIPYDDTDNPGGVYILAVCQVGATSPSQCKYDAFRLPPAPTPTPCVGDSCPTPTPCIGDACVGPGSPLPLAVAKDAIPSFDRTFHWTITKSVDQTQINEQAGGSATFNYTVTVSHDSGTDSNWKVGGNITLSNPNAVTDGSNDAVGVDVTDDIESGPIASLVPDPNANCTVYTSGGADPAENSSVTLPYSCTYSGAPADTSETNHAHIFWILPASSTDTADFFLQGLSFDTPTNKIDDCVTVTDTFGGTLGTVCSTDPSPTTFKYSHTFSTDPGGTCTSHSNTATFTTNTTGTTGSDSKTVKVCVGEDLAVSKTATPAFTRTYGWNIQKGVNKTLVEQFGGTATFTYTVNVNQTGFTDSAWVVSGTITVSNPNDWEAISANVTDAVDNGGSCTVTGGAGVSVPASSSITLNYSCTYASAPSSINGTNTATAAWDSAAFFTPDGSAQGTAGFAFLTPTSTVNRTITVTDKFNATTTTLGTLTATDAQPWASASYVYSRTVNVPVTNCVKDPNTATIAETAQSASQTVEICGPAATGALTMGFWQNKNGQGIITGGAAVSGVCKSGTWLRQYAPFQDLSATATCSQVATYVYNLIKAANASGTSMNAMLKAQMLATALDVYFSDPALGGNKITAPAPLGGVTIDLTKICKMIDSTGGTGTCSGNSENVSSAFGGAASLSISQMLAYAGSQSNAGGSWWYANVKATQQLAKDAFDAVNNQVAFAP